MAAFNDTAIGAGPTRQKYEKRLQNSFRKAFEVILVFFSFCFPMHDISRKYTLDVYR